jgi:hypothetical protein
MHGMKAFAARTVLAAGLLIGSCLMASSPVAASPMPSSSAAASVVPRGGGNEDGTPHVMIWGIYGFYTDYEVCTFMGTYGTWVGWWRAYSCDRIDRYSYALWVDYV